MATTLYYTNIITPLEVIERGAVVISDEGKIVYVGALEEAPRLGGLQIDLKGRYVAPGFIDIHTHGGKGVEFGVGNPAEGLRIYSEWVASTGVTGFLCSLAAPNPQALAEIVSSYAEVMQAGVAWAEPLGIHLECPYLNKERKGAFNPAWLRLPDLEEAEAIVNAGRGWVRQMTVAPELPGAQQVAASLRRQGVVVALGHSNTDYETASAALKGNFTHVTHTFNAQSGFHHRQPGVFGAVMASDEVTAELVGDTVHVHPGAIKVLVRCLGADRVVLITDAMAGAGMPDGEYGMIGLKTYVKNGRATHADGTIASSTATLGECVRNVHQQVGLPLPQAVKMGSLNPARAMGFANRLGSIAVGKDASLVVIDEDVNVYMTIVKGKVVYSNL